MTIQGLVTELESIKAEIQRNNDKNKTLRSRSKVVEKQITSYLESKDQEGVKYKGKSFVVEKGVSRQRKLKKDKEDETMRLLSNMGVHDTRTAYNKIMDLQKGDEIETTKLRVKKDKKKDTYLLLKNVQF